MDVFAHTLWTNALFHWKYPQQRRLRYLAAFFGVAPDLVGFAPLFVYLVFSGRMFSGESFPFAATNWTFAFAEQAYNYTHSLVIFAVIFGLVLAAGNLYKYFKVKSSDNPEANADSSISSYRMWFFWPMLGWPLHILIDLPTHPDFYQTPVLFPLSSYRFSGGVSWAHPVFMAVNYGALVVAYIAIYIYQKKKYDKKTKPS